MTGFDAYDAYISRQFSVDRWSEDGIDAARDLLHTFSIDDWDTILSLWSGRPSDWKVRCAEAMDCTVDDRALILLLDMLQDSDNEVLLAAADALRDWPTHTIEIGSDLASKIDNACATGGVVTRTILNDFLTKVTIV